MPGYGNTMQILHCCESGSGIRCFLTPGSGMKKNQIQLFDADPVNPESEMVKVGSGIRDKHPGSATLESTKLINQQSKIT
jgi:hypothetical protein